MKHSLVAPDPLCTSVPNWVKKIDADVKNL